MTNPRRREAPQINATWYRCMINLAAVNKRRTSPQFLPFTERVWEAYLAHPQDPYDFPNPKSVTRLRQNKETDTHLSLWLGSTSETSIDDGSLSCWVSASDHSLVVPFEMFSGAPIFPMTLLANLRLLVCGTSPEVVCTLSTFRRLRKNRVYKIVDKLDGY